MTTRRRPWVADGNDSTRVITREHLLGEMLGYLMHCRALLMPGTKVPVFYDPRPVGDLPGDLDETDLRLIVEEVRGQLAHQSAYLADIRSRAQAMATVALTELGLLAATAGSFVTDGGWHVAGWVVCFVCVILGLSGMASVATSRADVYSIRIGRLLEKRHEGGLLASYADELTKSVPLGQAMNDARQIVFRGALTLMTLGGVGYGVLWLFTVTG